MNGLSGWIARQTPTRESLAGSRLLRPFARRIFHPALWRFTRRSVPRGVALGLLVGIFLLIPGVQIAGVALLALPFRANIPLGAAMTFLSMPATTPFIIAASVFVGDSVLHLGADTSHFYALITERAPVSAWLDWLVSGAAPAMFAGLLIIAIVMAVIGYFMAALIWRWRVGMKWKRRRSKSLASGG